MTGYESKPIEHELRDIARWFNHCATREADPETKQSRAECAWICSKAADEIERLRAKLEWMPDGPDGIDCRNETIKLQDENVSRLRARVAELERQIDAATDVICDLGGELREPDMIESQRVRDDLRARVAELEAKHGEPVYIPPMIDIPCDIHPGEIAGFERGAQAALNYVHGLWPLYTAANRINVDAISDEDYLDLYIAAIDERINRSPIPCSCGKLNPRSGAIARVMREALRAITEKSR